MPAVSVILPTFNRAHSLERAVNSVLAQSFADLELIIVDDASTDDTPRVAALFDDPRVRYLRRTVNAGAAAARNAGIAEAGAEWLAFQDSDDEWLATKLEQQLAAARGGASGAGLIIGGYQLDWRDDELDVVPSSTLAGDPTPDLLDGWPIITPTWLVRRDVIDAVGTFDESMRCLEDWDLAFRISARFSVGAVRGPILIKHGSADSVFESASDTCSGLETILARHRDRWRSHPKRLARRLAHLGCVQVELGRRRAGIANLGRSLAKNPGRLPHYGLLAAALAGPGALKRAQARWPWDAGMALTPR